MAQLQRGVAYVWAFRVFEVGDPTVPATGLGSAGWTLQLMKDGAAFQSMSAPSAVSERTDGWYTVTVSASDMTADMVVLKAAHAAILTKYSQLHLQLEIVADLQDISEIQVAQQMANTLAGYDASTGAQIAALNDLDSAAVAAAVFALLPTNFIDLAVNSLTGGVVVFTNGDKTGYRIDGTKTRLDDLADFNEATDGVTVANGGITSASITDASLTNPKFATDAISLIKVDQDLIDAIAAAVADETYDGAFTLRELIRIVAASTGGKVSGAETSTILFRAVTDAKTRMTATVDDQGNRTAVTHDAT